MTETEPKFRVSRSAEKFEVTGRNLQLYRRLVGRTSLSLSEDKPEFSSAIGGQAVADRDNRVCVFGTTKYAQMFALTINSDHNIHDSWHIFDQLPPTATLFNQGSHWSLECEIPLAVLEQLSADLVSRCVESVAIKIEWPFGFIDNLSGAWGFFEGGQLRGHVSTFTWLLLTERSHGAAAESTQKPNSK
jgi:hypothetical protein